MNSSKRNKIAIEVLHDAIWDQKVCLDLLDKLWTIRASILKSEARYSKAIDQVGQHQRASARNLIHYLALRATDLRGVQEKLGWLGVSSLGRSESHVLANLDKVIGILHRLTNQQWQDHSFEEPSGSVTGQQLLQSHANLLLGQPAPNRQVRIMVTLPSETATDYGLVRRLVGAGMDIARINCAHDDSYAWIEMAHSVRRAAKAMQREVKILMDLGGPKIRTGRIEPGPRVLKLRPSRDEYGNAVDPSRLRIATKTANVIGSKSEPRILMDKDWLARLRIGKQIHFKDARGKKRRLLVVETDANGVIAESLETYYLTPETSMSYQSSQGKRVHSSFPNGIDAIEGSLRLHKGDRLKLIGVKNESDVHIEGDLNLQQSGTPRVTCTLPQVLEQVRAGERVWFDDGKIGGVIRGAINGEVEIEVVHARDGGETLLGDKGINFPDSHLKLPALTVKDIQDLESVVQLADMVGLSFVQEPGDVTQLLNNLRTLKGDHVHVVLKIETLKGFENLPGLMLAAMAAPSAGVMIARGDLAVECGYERMAEIQEEILWCSEAAHMPVIWATQVLETLAKSGVPSRAEISDAGMGVRAECVMLNKGPYITDAIRMLDDILRRMAGHQSKKKSLLRALRSWDTHELL